MFRQSALGPRRGEVVLATKFGMGVAPQRKGAKPEYVRQALEDSLRRLGTDSPEKGIPRWVMRIGT